ncbi:hypothetical protein [Hymenobacter ruricola]|uniref:Glycosyltransferase RgtA/B/C/D-like domain-containing protein n=1 Tax=Hymenobacter ruricola TaxID=2791023 RepID=A0ABS0I1B5_9BACT|nr:hypothetical protein [Hymenobacter ruricola]MBF9220725.1 hypothetical protein [Hymenobacter ruricola]
MRIVIALLLNGVLLAVLLPWVLRQWREAPTWARAMLAWGLGGRLLVGAWRGWRLADDADFISQQANSVTRMILAGPSHFWQALFTDEVGWRHQIITYYGMSNTLFMAKILAWVNLASMNSGWLNGVYLSLFSFVGCWQLAKTCLKLFPATPPAAATVAFVAWPTVVFWAAGVAKEPLLLGSGTWLVALYLQLLYGPDSSTTRARVATVVGLLVLAYVHFFMRYFFAAPLLGALVGLVVVRVFQQLGWARSRWAQVLVMVAVLAAGGWVATEVSVAFRLNKFTNQTMRIYAHSLEMSAAKAHIEYPALRPTAESFLRHSPEAALNAFTRPWLGESWQPLYVAAALENLVLVSLFATTFFAGWRRRWGHLPFGLVAALSIFCFVLAVLLGLSTPNFGSLNRYRSAVLPYLVFLLLQNDYAALALRRLGLERRSDDTLAESPPSVAAPATAAVPL